jgi:hypothetical protein
MEEGLFSLTLLLLGAKLPIQAQEETWDWGAVMVLEAIMICTSEEMTILQVTLEEEVQVPMPMVETLQLVLVELEEQE